MRGPEKKTPKSVANSHWYQAHSIKEEEFLQQMVLSQVDIHMQKNETDHYLQTIFKH